MDFIIKDNILIRYDGSDTCVVIPDGITRIDDFAFDECIDITNIVIPNSVTEIGDFAFAYCDSLKSIDIPNSVKQIGDNILYGCVGLADANGLVIYNNILYYYFGSETKIEIPDNVTKISSAAFDDCRNLTTIVLSDEMEVDENWPFLDSMVLEFK